MKPMIITISRQYGSGGRLIGQSLAERLRIPFYDKEIIQLAAQRSGISERFLAHPEQYHTLFASVDACNGVAPPLTLANRMFLAEKSVITELAQGGSCVVVGCGAGEALQGELPLLRVFIHADLQSRKRRLIEEYGEPEKNIAEKMKRTDQKRAAYFKFYTGVDGRQMENYHLCLDSGLLGLSGAESVIHAAYLALCLGAES